VSGSGALLHAKTIDRGSQVSPSRERERERERESEKEDESIPQDRQRTEPRPGAEHAGSTARACRPRVARRP
jgi:hypothetical protein